MGVPELQIGQVTIDQVLQTVVSRQPDQPALIYPELNLSYTYQALHDEVLALSKSLLAIGVRPGDRVALWAPNLPRWVMTQLATAHVGAVLVAINTGCRTVELSHILNHAGVSTLIVGDTRETSGNLAQILEAICPEITQVSPESFACATLPVLKNVIQMGVGDSPGVYAWEDFLALGRSIDDSRLAASCCQNNPGDMINMQYTSGTTGFPRGVMLSHTNLLAGAQAIVRGLRIGPQDRMCVPVPFHHCFGRVIGVLTALVAGATLVPVIHNTPETVLRAVEGGRCTALYGVPTMFMAQLDAMQRAVYDLASLRTGIIAGAPCPMHLMKRIVHDMGIRDLCVSYGQTETSHALTLTLPADSLERRVATVGRALPGIEVQLVDPATRQPVRSGSQGEVATRGDHVMLGYFNDVRATREVLDADGWLYTGDLAVMDDQGYLKITGRLKDVLIKDGETIFPREIEEFLYALPAVRDAQVVGVPSDDHGEEIVAFLRVRPGMQMSEEEIRAFCHNRISPQKVPRHVLFVDDFPTTPSGKVQKFRLREQALSQLTNDPSRFV